MSDIMRIQQVEFNKLNFLVFYIIFYSINYASKRIQTQQQANEIKRCIYYWKYKYWLPYKYTYVTTLHLKNKTHHSLRLLFRVKALKVTVSCKASLVVECWGAFTCFRCVSAACALTHETWRRKVWPKQNVQTWQETYLLTTWTINDWYSLVPFSVQWNSL